MNMWTVASIQYVGVGESESESTVKYTELGAIPKTSEIVESAASIVYL